MTGDPLVNWYILDTAGDVVGTVGLPPGLTAMAARVDQIWGMEMDELDLPSIVSYRVTSPWETDRS